MFCVSSGQVKLQLVNVAKLYQKFAPTKSLAQIFFKSCEKFIVMNVC